MRKQSILSITSAFAFALLISSCWFLSCRKSQQEVSLKSVEGTADKVSAISQNSDLLSLLAAKVEKQINAGRASENIAAFAGQPNWEQSIILEKNDASSRSKKKKAKAIVYTPFTKKNERKTAAILQSKIYDTDTVFQMLYPQQYLQYGFGAHSDTAWNAYDLFNIFASFDYSLFGTSQYIVTDGRIFGKSEKDILLVTRQSGSVSSTANGRIGSSGSKIQAISICTTWTSCVYGTDVATGSNSCKTTQTCTTYWIEIGDGGGGSTTPGSTIGGGGTAGTPSNDPVLNPSPCSNSSVVRYDERAAPISNNCDAVWNALNTMMIPCASSFNFVQQGNSQSAVITDYRFSLQDSKTKKTYTINIGMMEVSMPAITFDNQKISSRTAQQMAAQAAAIAEGEVMHVANAQIIINPSSTIDTWYYKKMFKDQFAEHLNNFLGDDFYGGRDVSVATVTSDAPAFALKDQTKYSKLKYYGKDCF